MSEKPFTGEPRIKRLSGNNGWGCVSLWSLSFGVAGMVYSSGFKFVQSHNDRFSGCVDDSYRVCAIFFFEDLFFVTWALFFVFVFEHLLFRVFPVAYGCSLVVGSVTVFFGHGNLAFMFVVGLVLRLGLPAVIVVTFFRFCSINVFDVVWQFYLFRRSVCGSRGISVTECFFFHFFGDRLLTLFVFGLVVFGEVGEFLLVSFVVPPEVVRVIFSRVAFGICFVCFCVMLFLCPVWGGGLCFATVGVDPACFVHVYCGFFFSGSFRLPCFIGCSAQSDRF
ncbi:hypothetical protein [Escherichia coli]|uniref:hypothetical protein n=1 Tax=Escherichia coli TaxID=562 RepID=UPI000A5794D4|nr:hypothetical protein [Escherichia coli]